MDLISCKLCNKNIEKKAFDCMYCQAVLKTPKRNKLGASLILGAIIFGIGWGLVGLCPGPAIASLSYFRWESIVFLLAMVAGLYMDRFYYSMFAQR